MPQRTGEYRDRIIIQKRTETADAAGQPVRSWSEYAVRWAKRRVLSGAEAFEDGTARRGEQVADFRTHYTQGVGPKMRVLHPGAVTTLATSVTTSTGTTLKVADTTGFPLEGKYRARLSDELVEVTSGQGTTTWTVARGVDGTTAATGYDAGQAVQLMQPYDIEDASIDFAMGAETVIRGRMTDGIA